MMNAALSSSVIARLALMAGCSVVAVGAAAAQTGSSASKDTSAAQTPADATNPANPMADIIVVARRSEERLQSVPLSITAVSNAQLSATTVTTGTDLQKLVPTLNVGVSIFGSSQQYSLRGVRTGVVTYFNEVPVSTSAADLQLWDLQSVQAIAGPQGTLFGRNSTGGAVLFVPQRPKDEFGGYVDGRIGSYNLREVTGVINVPIADVLKVRLGVQRTKRDALTKNISGPDMNTQDRTVVRASVLFEPTSWLSNYTVFLYSHRDERPLAQISGSDGVVVSCPTSIPSCVYGATYNEELLDQHARGIRTVSIPLDTRQYDEPWLLTNILSAQAGDITFKYIAGYGGNKQDQFTSQLSIALPVIVGDNESKSRQHTHELEILGSMFDNRLTWVGGLYYWKNRSNSLNRYLLFAPAGTVLSDLTTQQTGGIDQQISKAVYGQATFAATDRLKLTAGVRYTKDKQLTNQVGYSPGLQCNLPDFPNVDLTTCHQRITSTSDAVTYNFSVDYELSDKVLVYATTRKGYNAGGFNANINDPKLEIVKPEYIRDYEAGVKADWNLGLVPIRTNISAFLSKYKDIQRTTSLILDDLVVTGNFNAAAATIYGGQIEVLARPVTGFDLQASYGYLQTKYDSFDNPLVGNLTGNKFAQAPTHTLHLAGTYTYPLSVGELVANASYGYTSSVTFADDNITTPGNTARGYGLVDARLSWNNVAGLGIDASVYVKNATNKKYILNATDRTTPFGFVSRLYGDQRTVGLQVRYSFGDR